MTDRENSQRDSTQIADDVILVETARENLRNPDSALAQLMLAYRNGVEAGTTKWKLPEK